MVLKGLKRVNVKRKISKLQNEESIVINIKTMN